MMFCKRGGGYDEESNYATISRSLVFGDEKDAIDDTLYFGYHQIGILVLSHIRQVS